MSLNRIKNDLVKLGEFGSKQRRKIEKFEDLDKEEGITRFTGSDADKEARDFIVELMEDAGMDVKIDRVGNIFGIKEGSNRDKRSVLIGSHIDTVRNGGMFDGSLGVIAGLEAVRRLDDEGFDNGRTIEIVVYTAEEGSSFPKGLLGSSVLVGKVSPDEALKLRNEDKESLEGVLDRIGYHGDYEKDLDDIEYALELHVEQGPVLDEKDIPIGIVENITGYAWLKVTIEGEENHAGTTPMNMRRDPLVGASELVRFVNQRATEIGEESNGFTVGTVGRLSVYPNGTNVIPGKVEMGIDVRDVIKDNVDTLVSDIHEKLDDLEDKYSLNSSIEIEFEYDPVSLSDEVTKVIKDSVEGLNFDHLMMNSGAGHDSQKIAEKVKTGMIFVPSVNGVSHSPMEWTEWEDVEKGVRVLTETIKNLSK